MAYYTQSNCRFAFLSLCVCVCLFGDAHLVRNLYFTVSLSFGDVRGLSGSFPTIINLPSLRELSRCLFYNACTRQRRIFRVHECVSVSLSFSHF